MGIKEVMKIKDPCIYRITFPDGKKYIGQTKNLSNRFKLYSNKISSGIDLSNADQAIAKFGIDNIDIDILSRIMIDNKSDLIACLSILEIKYIRSENTLYPNGYNSSIGGELLNIPVEYLSTEYNIDFGCKPLLLYNSDGIFIKEYSSINECAYDLGVDKKTIKPMINRRDTLFASKYMIRSKKGSNIPKEIIPFKPKTIKKRIYDIQTIKKDKIVYNKIYKDEFITRKIPIVNRRVLMYNSEGEYCNMFESATDAARYLGRKSIAKGVMVKGYIIFDYDGGEIRQKINMMKDSIVSKYKSYNDILTLKEGENIPSIILEQNIVSKYKVAQYSLNGNYIKTYDSLSLAAEDNLIFESGIRSCMNGTTRRAGSFIWRKVIDGKIVEPTKIDKKISSERKRKLDFKIIQKKINGDYVCTYNNISDAANKTGISYGSILSCIKGKTKRAGEYLWLKED